MDHSPILDESIPSSLTVWIMVNLVDQILVKDVHHIGNKTTLTEYS